MHTAYASSQYQEMQVQTTPGRLVVMLYDGALRFLHLGLNGLRAGDFHAQGINLGKAQNILCELLSTLDPAAGEIAVNLQSIYRYCLERLMTANAQDNAEYVEEVIRLLSGLRDAWEQAERVVRAGEAGVATPLVGAAR